MEKTEWAEEEELEDTGTTDAEEETNINSDDRDDASVEIASLDTVSDFFEPDKKGLSPFFE